MRRFFCGLLLWIVATAQVLSCSAASALFGGKGVPVKGFKLEEPYPPPHESQTRSRLEGGKAFVLPSGSADLSDGVVLYLYSETNTPILVVRAQYCFYDSSNHLISSTGPVQMQTADGKFAIQGTGFTFWQQTNSTNSSLIISNDVHTRIESASLASASTNRAGPDSAQEGPLEVDSKSFSYDGATGLGIWTQNVHVTGTNLVVLSQELTAEVPVKDGQVRSLLAEKEVDVKYGSMHATGGILNYAPATGLIRLSQNAAWDSEDRRGHGDELMIDRTNHIFQVIHHAWLRLPGHALGQSGFLASSPSVTNAPALTNFVEISCDNYEIRTNSAIFRNGVLMQEHVGNVIRSKMTCSGDMSVTFSGTNEFQTLTAAKEVKIGIKGEKPGEDRIFTADRAFYTHTNGVLELTGKPTWEAGLTRGKGEVLRINTVKEEMFVQGNASMRLPANQLSAQVVSVPRPNSGTNVHPNAVTNQPPRLGTNQFAEIFCEEYTLGTNHSVFVGGVYATHPEMNWWCETLLVQTPGSGVTNLIADQNVVFEVMSQSGPFHGTGDHAVYTFGTASTPTNTVLINEMRLTGTPAVLTNAARGGFRNPLVIWDRARDTLRLPGNEYLIQGAAKPVATNIFVLPNKKRTK
ncbi:MAG TPA: LptA/OstA family protein [Verrucomicrobiae bacterium]|nr:LptA/OstA family protein [Verrucomicrobiae bacterium]